MTALVFLVYFFFAGLFLHGILPDWTHYIVGGYQDTRVFLWNLWWFERSVDLLHTNPFYTPLWFHPFGLSLLATDYPAWNNVMGTLFMRAGAPLYLATTLTHWITWTLNGFTVYLLAKEILRRVIPEEDKWQREWPAWVAGFYAMTHSYGMARSLHNWGQLNFFGIALFFWGFARSARTGRARDAILAGFGFAFTAACHFYFVVYNTAIWGLWLLFRFCPWRLHARIEKPASGARRAIGLFLLLLGSAVAAWIVVAQPGAITLMGHLISVQTPSNALLVFWVGTGLFLSSWLRFNVVAHPVVWEARELRRQAIMIGSALVFLSPLIVAALGVIAEGGYPKQHILWKTHPLGLNVFAFFAPNLYQKLWGRSVVAWFLKHNWNPEAQAGALGWTALLVFLCSGIWKHQGVARRWLLLAAGACVFSMGIYLHIGAHNTWCPLPFYFWRLLPLMGNVRVPERWMAVGTVALGVVLALSLVALAKKWRVPLKPLCFAIGVLILLENWPGLPAAQPPAEEPVYARLRQEPMGGVLAMPFYAGDSSVGEGDALADPRFIFPWDHVWAQRYHLHPVAGGYFARVPKKWLKAYAQDPFFSQIIRLEENPTAAPPSKKDPPTGCQAARQFGLSYVLYYVNGTAKPAWDYVKTQLPLELLESQPDIELYRIKTCSN